jgi:hypothetical protein
VLALAAPGVAQADIVVNTTQDAPSDDDCAQSSCKLRDAVAVALRTGETVRVPANTYQLTEGAITLNGVRIVGDGALTTVIDGRGMSGVFRSAQGANAISGVTITNGTGTYGQFVGGGGILAQTGSLTVTDSAIVGNTVPGLGGGIASGVTLTLVGTTVAGNVSNAGLPGQPGQQGGGLYIGGGSASLTNSTVSGNRATTGGNIFNAGLLSLNFVTIAADALGGGLNQATAAAAATSTTMSNSIVAGSAGPACTGTVAQINATAGSHNVIDDTTCALGGTGDRENVDPALGGFANNGGQTSTHALVAGSPAIGAANPAACAGTDQRGVGRPQEGTCDSGAFEYVPPQPSQPPPDDSLPPPVLHEKVNAIPARGTIRIKRPGAKRFRKLADDGAQLPVGTTVDALKGRVRIVAASDGQGGTDTAVFYGGIFKIAQTKGNKPTTILRLTEKLSCPKAGSASIAAKRKKKRRLWGDGEGKFRTKGKHSAATVVGTKWLVEDRCRSTRTRVVRGRVSVRDFAKKKTVIVRAGKKYTARAG